MVGVANNKVKHDRKDHVNTILSNAMIQHNINIKDSIKKQIMKQLFYAL